MAKRSSLNDHNFLQALKNNDSIALEKLYREVFPQVAHFVLQNSGDIDDAQDIFQDAVIVTLRYLKKPDFELTVQLNTFLVTIAKNMWLKQLRKKKKVPLYAQTTPIESMPDDSNLEASIAFDGRCAIVVEMLAELGPECRRLLTGFYFEKNLLVNWPPN